MRLLICGGRHFGRPLPTTPPEKKEEEERRIRRDKTLFYDTIVNFVDEHDIKLVIHGAARGADEMAGEWAKREGIPVKAFPAQWTKYGRLAGHMRNKQMLEQGKPTMVLAFPGGRGTADCVSQAEKAGIMVIKVEEVTNEK